MFLCNLYCGVSSIAVFRRTRTILFVIPRSDICIADDTDDTGYCEERRRGTEAQKQHNIMTLF